MELSAVRDRFGVADEQVLRDHAISHVLAALSDGDVQDHLVFIGGTALSRTFLTELRLSEDIDLLATGPRAAVGAAIEDAVGRGLQRSHGTTSWQPSIASTRGSQSSVLVVGQDIRIRVQLLAAAGYPPWPTERRPLEQRYTDAPPATLTTPTAPAFAGWKTVTWMDRHTPRDLYDLWGLGRDGHIDAEAARLFRTHGPTAGDVQPWMFDRVPSTAERTVALGHQGRVEVGPGAARDAVRAWWRGAVAT
ncbi:nucleotidyl transferase AbiEii/AbiGii toxin family protein [Klenkia taihuensis]|uniref:Nucleotidyl transferase AbiEii toxin, Type IV TA system n=1 Tax=Klenkia taihuensis TaxID=1225127 RepID=A0A1I1PWS1_9ACTN|nr:nucleotidyl transferase AbiEii/AbiGii toxin family protein [Klenkia taihuensis]SFD14225.1 Nucleotidyl transferase AbiEii toxin, Type IV TA system [Klenkia taihuensis]